MADGSQAGQAPALQVRPIEDPRTECLCGSCILSFRPILRPTLSLGLGRYSYPRPRRHALKADDILFLSSPTPRPPPPTLEQIGRYSRGLHAHGVVAVPQLQAGNLPQNMMEKMATMSAQKEQLAAFWREQMAEIQQVCALCH